MSDGESQPSDADEPTRAEVARRIESLRGPLTRFFAKALSDHSEIDDLIQEVCLRIVRRGVLEDLRLFDGYVFQTASSVLKDRHRRRDVRQSDRHVHFEPEIHADVAPGPEAGLIARQSLSAASLVLMELPERTRSVFVLRRLEDLSFAEIAARLGVSLSSAEKHMLRASRHLMARLGDIR